MNFSRRSFLWTGSKVGVAAALMGRFSSLAFGQSSSQKGLTQPAGLGTPIPSAALGDPLYRINRAMFTQNLKSKFLFSLGGVKLTDMTLTAVNDLNSEVYKSEGTGTKDFFLLVFTGPRGLQLQQRIHTVEHSRLGRFELFIVPGENNLSGRRYEAMINRLYP